VHDNDPRLHRCVCRHSAAAHHLVFDVHARHDRLVCTRMPLGQCSCIDFRPREPVYRVTYRSLAVGGWFDTKPTTWWQITDPAGEVVDAMCTGHRAAFDIAAALADQLVLRNKRHEAMMSGRHPAGRANAAAHAAFDSVLVAEERLEQARRRQHHARRQATSTQPNWRMPGADPDTIADKADHYRER